MENLDMKYNRILEKIKETEPVLDDAEVLTDSIMRRVEQRTANVGQIRVMRILGIISSAAAAVLMCLFAYETLKYQVSPMEKLYPVSSAALQILPSNTIEFEIRQKSGSIANATERKAIIETVLKNREAQRMRKELTTKYIKSLN